MKAGDQNMELVDRIRRGDQKAWNELVSMYQRRVFVTALTLTKNLADADEITQDVFLKLYTNIQNIRDPKSLPAWLVRTAYNLACDRLRFQKVRWLFVQKHKKEDTKSLENTLEKQVETAQLMDVIAGWEEAKLSKQERIVMQLKIGEEMTFAEIADSLKISVSSAKTHYYRAKEKLKGIIEDLNLEEGHE